MRHEILIRYLSTLQHMILSQNVGVPAVYTAHMTDFNVWSLYLYRSLTNPLVVLRYRAHLGIETDQTIPS
jgi:hypothetical protein